MTRSLTSILIVLSMISLGTISFLAAGTSDTADIDVSVPATRGPNDDLDIKNGTFVVDKTTGSMEYRYVRILDNGRLEIKGATLKVLQLICRSDAVNTSFVMDGEESTTSLLSVTGGVLNIKSKFISISDATISVSNTTQSQEPGENGLDSSIVIYSRDSDLMMNDTVIDISGQDGAVGSTNVYGGAGGKAEITLQAGGNHNMNLSGSRIRVTGGNGGSAYSIAQQAGAGGKAWASIKGNSMEIRSTSITVQSGKAGARGPSSTGNFGGTTEMTIESKTDMILTASKVEAFTGLNSNDELRAKSIIKMNSMEGVIEWDATKSSSDRFKSLSSLYGDAVQVDAENGAELHEVDTADSPPSALGGTTIEIFWWIYLMVTDRYGNPIENAAFTYTIFPDPNMHDGGKSNANGETEMELVGRLNEDFLRYTFNAEDLGGARASSDQVTFAKNRNERAWINITQMILSLVNPSTNGEGDEVLESVGDVVTWEGMAQVGNTQNDMQSVTLYVDDKIIGQATDGSSSTGAPAFYIWWLIWDSKTVPDGDHILTIIGRDNSYTVSIKVKFNVNQEAVNHNPVLMAVKITDSLNVTTIGSGENTTVHVSQDSSVIEFTAYAWDRDARSPFLGVGEGKVIVSSTIRLIHLPPGMPEDKILEKVVAGEGLEKINETGGYSMEFEIDASKNPKTDLPFSEGVYELEIVAVDDAGKTSVGSFVLFDLIFDFYPNPFIFLDKPRNADNSVIRPSVDPESPFDSFKLQTKESHSLVVTFNFTDSFNYDDPVNRETSWSRLTYTFTVTPEAEAPIVVLDSVTGIAGVTYEFNVKDTPKGQDGKFEITLTVVDPEGLEEEVNYLVRVNHDPPPEKVGIYGQSFIDYGALFIIFPVLFVLMVLAYVGSGLTYSTIKKTDKRKKLELLQRKRDEQKKETITTIEDEVSTRYMGDSKKYLEATGASKGKEAFAKELEAAQVKGGAKPPEQPKAQAPAPAPAPKPGPEASQPTSAVPTARPPSPAPAPPAPAPATIPQAPPKPVQTSPPAPAMQPKPAQLVNQAAQTVIKPVPQVPPSAPTSPRPAPIQAPLPPPPAIPRPPPPPPA